MESALNWPVEATSQWSCRRRCEHANDKGEWFFEPPTGPPAADGRTPAKRFRDRRRYPSSRPTYDMAA